MKKSLNILLVAAITVLSSASHAAETIRIGFQKSATTLVLLKGEKSLEKRLNPNGISIQWIQFPGGPQLLEGLNVGAVDFGFTGETPPVFAQAAGADLLYIANEPASPTAEAIIVPEKSEIRNVKELKGKRIALNKGSNVHYLLLEALKEAGLAYSDIDPIYLSPADARAAFEQGSVDAWVIWDPFLAAAEDQTNARVLRDGTGIINNYQFYVSTKAFAEQNPELVQQIMQEIREIGKKATQDPDSVTASTAPLLGLPIPVVHVAVVRQNYDARHISDEVIASQQKIADTFFETRLIPKKIDVKQAVWK